MSYLHDYIDYLRDNPEHYWFKRKLYGWGWTPATWEGWFILFVFVSLLVWTGTTFSTHETEPSLGSVVLFSTKILALVIVLIAICYRKGERPRWQWGLPERTKPNPTRD